MCLEPV